jgi:uracil DNA glycosylase
MKFIKIDVINGVFSFDFTELCALYNTKEDIVWIDSFSEDQMYQAPFDYISSIELNPDIEELNGKRISINFDCNCSYADKTDLILLRKFHYSWFNELRPFLRSVEFKKYLIELKKHTTYPKTDLVFSEFLTNLNKTKGVWIGDIPYLSNDLAIGRAFGTWNSKTTKVLNVIKENIMKDLKLPHYRLSNDLVELNAKGILFLNYCLVADKKFQLLHNSLPFITEVIKILNKKEKISVICLGTYAKKLVPLFSDKFNIYTAENPLISINKNRDWDTNNVFVKFNNDINLEIK